MQQQEAMSSTKLPPRGAITRRLPSRPPANKRQSGFPIGHPGGPGRPKGSKNFGSILKNQVISRSGMTPLEFLTFAYRNQLYEDYDEVMASDGKTVMFQPKVDEKTGQPKRIEVPIQLRASCAQAAAPYVHKKMPVGIEVKEKNAAFISTERLRAMPTEKLVKLLEVMDEFGLNVDLASTREVKEEDEPE